MRAPGSIVLAPIMEPLGDLALPIADPTRIATPVGAVICKLKPQVIICSWEGGAMTAVMGSRHGRRFAKAQILGDSSLRKNCMRLVNGPRREVQSSTELVEIGVLDGNFRVRDSSVLNGGALNIIRFQDVEDCYNGSHITTSSIQPLIELMFESFAKKMRNLATAYRLQLETSINLSGRADTHRATPNPREKRGGRFYQAKNSPQATMRMEAPLDWLQGKHHGISTITDGRGIKSAQPTNDLNSRDTYSEPKLLERSQRARLDTHDTEESKIFGHSLAPGTHRQAPGSDTAAAKFIQDISMKGVKRKFVDDSTEAAPSESGNEHIVLNSTRRELKRQDHGDRYYSITQDKEVMPDSQGGFVQGADNAVESPKSEGRPFQGHGVPLDYEARHSPEQRPPSTGKPRNRLRFRTAAQKAASSLRKALVP